MARYAHVFFDLDRTLWDMDRNASETLAEMYDKFRLLEKGVPDVGKFVDQYNRINDELWDQYRRRLIDKETLRATRFRETLGVFGIRDAELSRKVELEFIREAPKKTNLVAGARELLDELNGKCQLHIITNGFPEVQAHKMKFSGLTQYFDVIVTSEECGFAKPDARIFEHALSLAGASREESVMIGDDLAVDIVGARECGWAQIFYNPQGGSHCEIVQHEVRSLKEIISLL